MKYIDSIHNRMSIDKRLQKPAWTIMDFVESAVWGVVIALIIFPVLLWLKSL